MSEPFNAVELASMRRIPKHASWVTSGPMALATIDALEAERDELRAALRDLRAWVGLSGIGVSAAEASQMFDRIDALLQ